MPERREYDKDGQLDEIVMPDCLAHLERVDGRGWFLELTRKDGSSIAVWLRSSKTRVEPFVEERNAP